MAYFLTLWEPLAAVTAAAAQSSTSSRTGSSLSIGYQKHGALFPLKGRGTLQKALKTLGFSVTSTEFPTGPQLLEGLNAGTIDCGSTGKAPPIFAKAAGAPLCCVTHEPRAPKGGVTAQQQLIAHTFLSPGLIPKAINVAGVVRRTSA